MSWDLTGGQIPEKGIYGSREIQGHTAKRASFAERCSGLKFNQWAFRPQALEHEEFGQGFFKLVLETWV